MTRVKSCTRRETGNHKPMLGRKVPGVTAKCGRRYISEQLRERHDKQYHEEE